MVSPVLNIIFSGKTTTKIDSLEEIRLVYCVDKNKMGERSDDDDDTCSTMRDKPRDVSK